MNTRNMLVTLCITAALTGLGSRVSAAADAEHAHGDHGDHAGHMADGQHGMHAFGVSRGDEAALREVLEAIEAGWETGSGAPFREHYVADADAYFVEGGGADIGLDRFVTHHVIPEGEALAEIDLSLEPLDMEVQGDLAWVLASTEFKARVRSDDRAIHSKGFETVVLRRVTGRWKVVHTHGSSRPVE